MTTDELLRHLQRRPFQAFRLHLTDGANYEIRHPEMMMVGLQEAEIGIPAVPAVPIYGRIVTIALPHVVRLEPIAAPPTGNGVGGG